MRYFLLLIFTFGITQLQAIAGTYSYSGNDPYDNVPYSGKVTITKINEQVYRGNWETTAGEKFQGTGIKNGNVISFVFLSKYLPEKTEVIGLVVYQIDGDTLKGPWIYWNQKLVGNEILVKINS